MRVAAPASWVQRWDAAGAPQRVAAIAAMAAAAIVVLVVLVGTPLREAIARAQADVARNRVVLDIARSRVAEDAALARAAAPTRSDDPRAAIERVLTQEGLAYAPLESSGTTGTMRVVVGDARFAALVGALDTLARDEGIHVVEATLTARTDPGTVRAELALAR